MKYIYETHLHTVEASACGVSPGRDYIRRYQDLGYTGIIVTDHFFRGNCGISRQLPWRERIEAFCRGYENAREEGEKAGFSVFFGWEENHDGDEYLVYGLDKAWLLAHPEAERWTRLQQYQAVRAAGGCVVQAHPFRQRAYIPRILLSMGCVDAVEGYNAGNQPSEDSLAVRYATALGLPVTAGSDIHSTHHWPDDQMMGVVFDQPLTSIQDYVNAIRQKRPFGIKAPKGRGLWQEGIPLSLPVVIRGSQDQSLPTDVWELLGRTGTKEEKE